jgi:hypothetical protein
MKSSSASFKKYWIENYKSWSSMKEIGTNNIAVIVTALRHVSAMF